MRLQGRGEADWTGAEEGWGGGRSRPFLMTFVKVTGISRVFLKKYFSSVTESCRLWGEVEPLRGRGSKSELVPMRHTRLFTTNKYEVRVAYGG